jgi:hypothetical protein
MKFQELNYAVTVSRLEPSLPHVLPLFVPVDDDLRLRRLLKVPFLLCLRYISVASIFEELLQKPLQLKLHDFLVEVLDADDELGLRRLRLHMVDAWVDVVEYVLQPYGLLVLSYLLFLFLQPFVVLLLVFFARDVVEVIIVVSAKLVVTLSVEVETIGIIEIPSLSAVLIV